MISPKEILIEPKPLSEIRKLAAERKELAQEEAAEKGSHHKKEPTFTEKIDGLFRRWTK